MTPAHKIVKPLILVVDDDYRLGCLLKEYLTENYFQVQIASRTDQAQKILQTYPVDLMILDHMLPQETGLEYLEKIRKQKNPLPILMLTALGETEHRIAGLEKGADDYLSKPFDPKELLLRIHKILDRIAAPHQTPEARIIPLGSYQFDLKTQTLSNAQGCVPLTWTEQHLLYLLARHLGQPISREALAKSGGVLLTPRAVDVRIARLRQKIEEDPKNPIYLRTVRHEGYGLWSRP